VHLTSRADSLRTRSGRSKGSLLTLLPSLSLAILLPAAIRLRLQQIARERFPEQYPSDEALAGMAARVLVFSPRTSQELLATLQASPQTPPMPSLSDDRYRLGPMPAPP
jgi:hypothetical protein